jgi:hypothetical protein
MSALSEGADRIVAKWAAHNGVCVAPILPTNLDEYEKTFSGTGYSSLEESIADFESILG